MKLKGKLKLTQTSLPFQLSWRCSGHLNSAHSIFLYSSQINSYQPVTDNSSLHAEDTLAQKLLKETIFALKNINTFLTFASHLFPTTKTLFQTLKVYYFMTVIFSKHSYEHMPLNKSSQISVFDMGL